MMLIMPRRENPVSSAQMPNVPPKLAILSDKVVLASRTAKSTFGVLKDNLTMIMFLVIVVILLKIVEVDSDGGHTRLFRLLESIDSLKSIAYSHSILEPEQ